MNRKKTLIFIAIGLIVATQIIIANAVGINVLDLVLQKTDSIAAESAGYSSEELQQAKRETLEEASRYVDEYISEVQRTLDQYANSETEAAKIKIKEKSKAVKDALDDSKTTVIENGKSKIKIKIDTDLDDILSDLDSQISIKIQQKFKD